jgi:hypothetical protein
LHDASAYDANGNVTDACPAEQFTAAHTPTAVCADGLKYSTHYDYDDLDRQKTSTSHREITDLSGAVTGSWTDIVEHWSYDRDSNTTSSYDDLGTQITKFDLNDRPYQVVSPHGTSATQTSDTFYDASGNVASVRTTASDDPGRSAITDYTYDASNRLVDTIEAASSVDPTGLVASGSGSDVVQNKRTRLVYDADSNVIGVFEPRAFYTSTPDLRFLTRTEFDTLDRPTTQWTPFYDTAASTPSETYLSNGDMEQADCPTPRTNHRPQSIPGLDYSSTTGLCVRRVQYDAVGNVVVQRDATGAVKNTDGTYPTDTCQPLHRDGLHLGQPPRRGDRGELGRD